MPKIYPLGNFPTHSPVLKPYASTSSAVSAPTNVSSSLHVRPSQGPFYCFSVWLLYTSARCHKRQDGLCVPCGVCGVCVHTYTRTHVPFIRSPAGVGSSACRGCRDQRSDEHGAQAARPGTEFTALGRIPRSSIAGSAAVWLQFPVMAVPLHFPTSSVQGFPVLQILGHLKGVGANTCYRLCLCWQPL